MTCAPLLAQSTTEARQAVVEHIHATLALLCNRNWCPSPTESQAKIWQQEVAVTEPPSVWTAG